MSNASTLQLGSRDTPSLAQVRFGLSDDVSVERLLSDVPFFCVGVMAFAVFTFFLVTKRSNLLATYLYSSTLLAFIAAIFDLSHFLTYGVSTGATKANSPNGLEIAREVGLSLSVGFRMIFFWGLVDAEQPSERPRSDNESLVSFRMGTYSSSWGRLGIFGRAIKWLLLLLITAIPVLQIVWRLYWRMHYAGPLYIIESSLEIAVLAFFVLKILLNVGLAQSTPWRSSLAFYAAPLLALALSFAPAIGNIIIFCFSETTLGRFLQAVSLYALILWVLIIAFRPIQPGDGVRRNRPRSSFQSAPEKGPRPPSFLPPLRLPEQTLFNARRPSVSRISSFIYRTPRPPTSPIEESLWNPKQSGHPFAGNELREADDDMSAKSIAMDSYIETATQPGGLRVTPEPSGWISSNSAVDVVPNVPGPSVEPRADSPDPRERASHAPSKFSLSAYYNPPDSPLPPPTPIRANSRAGEGSESPIYSLYGIIPSKSHQSGSSRLRPTSDRLSALIREQKEMDKAVSKLLSPRESLRSSYQAGKKDSFSVQSEFSLSNFPEPPDGGVQVGPSTPSPRGNTQKSRNFHSSFVDQVPANVESHSEESLEVPRTQYRMDSQGTQYDVTSFIGAGIRGSNDGGYPRPRKEYLSDIESADGGTLASPAEDRQRASRESTMMLNLQSNALLSTYAGGNEMRMTSPSPQPHFKPLYLGRGTPDTLDSPRIGLPPRPKISHPRALKPRPRPTVSRPFSVAQEAEPMDIYEKPRPPPLIFRTLNKPS